MVWGADVFEVHHGESERSTLFERGLEILHHCALQVEHIYEVLRSPSAAGFLELLPQIQEHAEAGRGGVIRFIGPMRGGKTLFALALAMSVFRDRHIVLAKSDGDPRDVGKVKSHAGASNENGLANCTYLSFGNEVQLADIEAQLLEAEFLVLDEVLFCSEEEQQALARITEERSARGLWTVVSSLDRDFTTAPMQGYHAFAKVPGINMQLMCEAHCECSGLPAQLTQRMDRVGKNGWRESSRTGDVIAGETTDEAAELRYGPRHALFHRLYEDLVPVEEECIQGSHILQEIHFLVEAIEDRDWEEQELTFTEWQQEQIRRWVDIREAHGVTALTRHELALLIQMTELFRKRELLFGIRPLLRYMNIVSLDGTIGVGKSTLVGDLEGERIVRVVKEDVDLSRWVAPSIGGTPDEKRQSALLAQMYYRVAKLNALVDEVLRVAGVARLGGHPSYTILLDRSIVPGDEVFIDMHCESGNITNRGVLTRVFDLFNGLIPQTRYYVMLTARKDVLDERQRNRGRGFEVGLSPDFLFGMQVRTQNGFVSLDGVPMEVIRELDTSDLKPKQVAKRFRQMVAQWHIHLPKRAKRL